MPAHDESPDVSPTVSPNVVQMATGSARNRTDDDLFFEPSPVVTAQLGRGVVWSDMLAQIDRYWREKEAENLDLDTDLAA